jgi:hypothetical protein
MFIHPFAAIFILFWLGVVSHSVVMATSDTALIPCGMFFFGIGLTTGCFHPEAFKAKRLLSALFLIPTE